MLSRLNALLIVLVLGILSVGPANAAYDPTLSTLWLSSSSFTAAQSAGSLSVKVARTGNLSRAASVHYRSVAGTASTAQFTPVDSTLSWAVGDSTPKSFVVHLNSATPFSGTKTFQLQLYNPTAARLGSGGVAPVTIKGSGVATVATVALATTSYTVAQTATALTVTAARTGSATGAVSVAYATANGTAVAGTNYTATSGTLQWASGEMAAKSFTIPTRSTVAFTGTKNFTIKLAAPSGAALGTPSAATATLMGSAAASPGAIALSAATYGINQSSGTLTVTATRTGGSTGAVTVAYATANGTAATGKDYTAKSGTLSWASADTAAKTFTVPISNTTPFTGTRTFAVALSGVTGGATLASPSSAIASITGSAVASAGNCAQNSTSYTTTGAYDSMQYGNYFVNNNNWGGTAGQKFWSNSKDCWGVTTTQTQDIQNITSYPSVTRGWSQNATAMQQASTAGTNDWTTKSGMGIAVTALTKAKIHWAFTAPTTSGIRWLGLQDIYFHKTNNPDPSEFPPFVDLMLDQAIADQVLGSTTYYAAEASASHGSTVTIGGNQYLVFIDDPDEAGYHQSGGHNIHLFNLPTAFTSNNALAVWGSMDADNDLGAIVKYFMQSNPKDDAGKPLLNASGQTITSPLIASNLYLNAINSGWEIDNGTVFTNTAFCVSLQNEADCP
jgi:hypothetical protein